MANKDATEGGAGVGGVLPGATRLLIGGDVDELPKAEMEMLLVSDNEAETAVALELLHLACLNSSCSGNGNLTTATGGCKCGVRDCGRAGAEELGGDGVNFGTSIWVWWAAGGAKGGGSER